MKESVVRKLEHLVERFEEVQALLGDPDVIGDQEKFRNLSKSLASLKTSLLALMLSASPRKSCVCIRNAKRR